MAINSLRKKNNVLDLIGMGFVSLLCLDPDNWAMLRVLFCRIFIDLCRAAAMVGGALLGYFYFLAGNPYFRGRFRLKL